MKLLHTCIAAALSFGLISNVAVSCEGDKASTGANVGQYEFNASTGKFHIIEWYYDSTLASQPQYPGETLIATWTAGGGGCGGVNCQPNAGPPVDYLTERVRPQSAYRERSDESSTFIESKSVPCRLPETVVTAAAPPTGGSRMIRRITGGGSFALFQRRLTPNAPNPSNNPNPAMCGSDDQSRLYHAATDFAQWRLANQLGTQIVGRGERARVTFNEHSPGVAGSEQYEWIRGRAINTTSPETWLAPVPNTLQCPK